MTDGDFYTKVYQGENFFSESYMQQFGIDSESLNTTYTVDVSESELFIQYVLTYLLIYLLLQGAINLIAWLVNKIRGRSYKAKEYEILLLIPIFLFYTANGLIFTSVIIALTIFTYVLYLSPTKQKEEKQ